MLYLLNHPDIEVLGVTVTGTGASDIVSGVRNALRLVQLAGRPGLPVARGVVKPLACEHRFPERRHMDTMQGSPLPDNPHSALDSALDFLREQLQRAKEPITILAIGPLTNVAQLIQAEPELARRIGRIVIMGGFIDAPGNVNAAASGASGNANRWPELNLYGDPAAAAVVLNSGIPVTLVPQDTAQRAPVSADFYLRLSQNHQTAQAGFVHQALTERYDLIASGALDFGDALAAVLLVTPELGIYREVNLRVHTANDERSGLLLLDEAGASVRVCLDADFRAFEERFLSTLNGEPAARSRISFVLDGQRITLDAVSPRELLIDYLHRPEVARNGTKLVCGQGGCGACTVMLTSYDRVRNKLVNSAVNACLRPLASLDGMMVTTTQGIGNVSQGIDEVQYKLAAGNGSQCGYCSPGFTMNMFTLRQNSGCLTQKQIEDRFDGNICRCTGYRPILDAFRQFASDYVPPPHQVPVKVDPSFKPCKVKPFRKIEPPQDFIDYMRTPHPLVSSADGYTWYRPITLEALYGLKAQAQNPQGVRLVCGNTSTGVYETQPIYAEPAINPRTLIDISAIAALQAVHVGEHGLELGGAVTLTRMMEVLKEVMESHPASHTRGLAALHEHLSVVANHQIRNEASLAGNLHMAANLGFLSDVAPMLATLDATVKVSWAGGSHRYPILELPRDAELPPDAIYESVHIPLTAERSFARAYKIRRRDEDCHALVSAGMLVRFDKHWHVHECRIVLNGIKADYADTRYGISFQSIELARTSALFKGRAWTNDVLGEALACLREELAAYEPPEGPSGPLEIGEIPFSFRVSVAEQLLYKFFVAIALESGCYPIPENVQSAGTTPLLPLSTGSQHYRSYPDEAPVSESYIKLDAFLQTTGEAVYTHDMARPPNTLEAAYVYSLIAFGQFYYVLPFTCAHGLKGERISAARLTEVLRDWHADFVDYVCYDDVPVKAANWIGLGNDDPIFVPSLDQALPDSVAPGKNFFPHHLTCVGAPIGLVVAKSARAAREIANAVRTRCIVFEAQPARSFEAAIAQEFYFEQTPPTNPTLTHIPEITRPGSDAAWLASPATHPLQAGGSELSVVTGSRRTGYQNHFYLEVMNTLAVPGENRSITLHTASQAIADNQYAASAALGIPAADVRVCLPRIGGGFGGRQSLSHFNSSAAAIAAWKLQLPVRLALDRNTNFIMCGERHAYVGHYAAAYGDDGKLHGFSLDMVSDGGNTYDLSLPVMDFSLQSCDNAYQIDTYRVRGQVCQTNKLSNTAFRSFGFVQAVNLSEQAIEHVAYKLGKTPEEIREKNLYKTGSAKWHSFCITDQTLGTLRRLNYNPQALTALESLKGDVFPDMARFEAAVLAADPTGTFTGPLNMGNMTALKQYSTTAYDFTPYMEGLQDCKLPELWQRLKRDCEFEGRRAEVEAFNAANRWRKRGLSMIPLKYGIAYSDSRGVLDQAGAYVTAYAFDGSVLVAHGGVDMGQGLQTKLAQVAAQTLGIDLSLIRMAATDTRVVGDASPTAASTGSDLNGGAVQLACRALRQRLEKFCEDLEQYTIYFSRFDPVKMDAESVKQMRTVALNWREHWSEVWPLVCSLAYDNRVGLSAEARFKSPNFSSQDISHPMGNTFTYFTYAVAASEVEIDVLTGETVLRRSDILFDVGRSLNPLIDIGQIEGGFVQGIGYLTMEELTYQGEREAPRQGYPEGALTTTNTWEYKPPGARSIPLDLRVHIADDNLGKATAPGQSRSLAAVNRSKGIGEPPLVLANTVFFAIKQAIQAFYRDQGHDAFVELDAPATVIKIQTACRQAIQSLTV